MRAATDRRHKNAIEMITWNNFNFVMILWLEYINLILLDPEKNTDSLGNIGLSKRKKLSEISLTRWLCLCWISALTYSTPRSLFCVVIITMNTDSNRWIIHKDTFHFYWIITIKIFFIILKLVDQMSHQKVIYEKIWNENEEK